MTIRTATFHMIDGKALDVSYVSHGDNDWVEMSMQRNMPYIYVRDINRNDHYVITSQVALIEVETVEDERRKGNDQ